MKIGLYFGSFNPIHNGHLMIANKMLEVVGFDEVWFIPSPLNPFKKSEDLLDFKGRFQMIEAVIKSEKHLKVDAIENTLSKPSYTIQTLEALEKIHTEHQFELIIGSDNLENLHLWKQSEEIIQKYPIHVYSRSGFIEHQLSSLSNVHIYSLPLLDISSTSIRNSIKTGKSVVGEIDSKIDALILKNAWFK